MAHSPLPLGWWHWSLLCLPCSVWLWTAVAWWDAGFGVSGFVAVLIAASPVLAAWALIAVTHTTASRLGRFGPVPPHRRHRRHPGSSRRTAPSTHLIPSTRQPPVVARNAGTWAQHLPHFSALPGAPSPSGRSMQRRDREVAVRNRCTSSGVSSEVEVFGARSEDRRSCVGSCDRTSPGSDGFGGGDDELQR